MQISRNEDAIDQAKYVYLIPERLGIQDSKPLAAEKHLIKDVHGSR